MQQLSLKIGRVHFEAIPIQSEGWNKRMFHEVAVLNALIGSQHVPLGFVVSDGLCTDPVHNLHSTGAQVGRKHDGPLRGPFSEREVILDQVGSLPWGGPTASLPKYYTVFEDDEYARHVITWCKVLQILYGDGAYSDMPENVERPQCPTAAEYYMLDSITSPTLDLRERDRMRERRVQDMRGPGRLVCAELDKTAKLWPLRSA